MGLSSSLNAINNINPCIAELSHYHRNLKKKDKMSEITKMSFKIDKKIIKVAQDSEQGILPDEGKEGWTKDKGKVLAF